MLQLELISHILILERNEEVYCAKWSLKAKEGISGLECLLIFLGLGKPDVGFHKNTVIQNEYGTAF